MKEGYIRKDKKSFFFFFNLIAWSFGGTYTILNQWFGCIAFSLVDKIDQNKMVVLILIKHNLGCSKLI